MAASGKTRMAGWSRLIRGDGQGGSAGDATGGSAHQLFDLWRTTLGTVWFFAMVDEQLEFAAAVFAQELKHRHRNRSADFGKMA